MVLKEQDFGLKSALGVACICATSDVHVYVCRRRENHGTNHQMRRPELSPQPEHVQPITLCGLPTRATTTLPRTTMATLQSIPRFLLPRGPHLLRPQPRALRPLPSTTSLRHASVSAKGLSEEFRRRREAQQSKGTPVIPQPDKYRPPSHSKKAPNRNLENKVYGPPISEEDRKRMATKKYPNMMSPEGTFSHWFLHNKAIHLWITMVINPSFPPSPTIHDPRKLATDPAYHREFSSHSRQQPGTWTLSQRLFTPISFPRARIIYTTPSSPHRDLSKFTRCTWHKRRRSTSSSD